MLTEPLECPTYWNDSENMCSRTLPYNLLTFCQNVDSFICLLCFFSFKKRLNCSRSSGCALSLDSGLQWDRFERDTSEQSGSVIIIPDRHYVKCSQMVAQTHTHTQPVNTIVRASRSVLSKCVNMCVDINKFVKVCQSWWYKANVWRFFKKQDEHMFAVSSRDPSPTCRPVLTTATSPRVQLQLGDFTSERVLFTLSETGWIRAGGRETRRMINGHIIWMTSGFGPFVISPEMFTVCSSMTDLYKAAGEVNTADV